MIDLHKQEGESEEQFIWRLGREKDAGKLDLGWEEIADIINREFREDDSEYRNESAYRKPYQQAKRFYEAGVFKDLTSEKYIELLKVEQQELKKERQKISDERLQYNRLLREMARDELICEKICNEIRALSELPTPTYIPQVSTEKEAILCFADTHYGAEFSIKGLFGEIINAYSPEIFEKRMQKLLSSVIDFINEKHLSKIKVFSLGDELDGILRVSQLMKLRYGVVESTVKYSEYICAWLSELTKYVSVEFYSVQGNHTELRQLGEPKGTFTKDNMSLVINEFIKERMKNNPNFKFIQNDSGLIFDNVCGYNILGIHGEVKNMEAALQKFTNIYNTKIDILVGGHKHHFSAETVGVDREVINVPSVVGVDDYSMSLGKTSNPGAILFMVERYNGVIEQRNFKL